MSFRSSLLLGALRIAMATIAFLVLASAADAQCLSYGGRVEVSGTLERKTFPGPPEYQSIAQGDAPETVWLVRLDTPTCVAADRSDPSGVNAGARGLKEMQLLLTDAQYRLYAGWVGTHVVLKGKLFGAATAHHRTPVLLVSVEFGR